MYAHVTFIQKTKNPDWDIVHCINADTGKVAIALCKGGVAIDDLVHVRYKQSDTGSWTAFATVKEG